MRNSPNKFQAEVNTYAKSLGLKTDSEFTVAEIIFNSLKSISDSFNKSFAISDLSVHKIKTGYSLGCNLYFQGKKEVSANQISLRSRGKNLPSLFRNFSKKAKEKIISFSQ